MEKSASGGLNILAAILSRVLAGSCLAFCLAPVAIAQLSTPVWPYEIRLSVIGLNHVSGQAIEGDVDIAEADGKFLYQFKDSSGTSTTLIYDGSRSFTEGGSTGNADFRPGFQYNLVPAPVLLPFNFQSFHCYGPLSACFGNASKERIRAAMQGPIRGFNASVYVASYNGQSVYIPAGVDISNGGRSMHLLAGSRSNPTLEADFSDIGSSGNSAMPGKITWKQWTQSFVNRQAVYTPSTDLALSLLSVSTDPIPAARFQAETYLKYQESVNYNDDHGGVGVEYDQRLGSLAAQAESMRRKLGRYSRVNRPIHTAARSWSTFYGVAGVFGLAIVLLVLWRKLAVRKET